MATRADLEQELHETESELSKLRKKYKKLSEDYKFLQAVCGKMDGAIDEVETRNKALIDFASDQQDHIQSMYEILETNLDRVLDSY